jgi:hypothetical protein
MEMIIKIHDKQVKLGKGVEIPEALVKEMENFVKRNSMATVKGEGCNERCCNRCLKAFSLKKAEEFSISQESIDVLDAMFNCEVGHEGYYMDGEGLNDARISLHKDS